MDWGLGRYELVARDLLPAASLVIDMAAPAAGELLLDVGCGTGNAALLAAERGAEVIGLDPSERLLDVAREESAARGLDANFQRGSAEALPLRDGAVDVVISVFGVIFAADAATTVEELARVTGPQARIVLSAWLPGGAIAAVARARGQALAAASGEPAQAPALAWHDRDALTGSFAGHGYSVQLEERELPFTDASPSAFLEREISHHPAWLHAREVLERPSFDRLRAHALEVLEQANEQTGRFRVTSHYVIATMRRV